MAEPATLYDNEPLPVGSKGRLSSGWWGMWALIATEAALFAYLLFSYYYIAAQSIGAWPPVAPKLDLAIPGTIVLLLGSLTMWFGERGIRQGRQAQLLFGLVTSIGLALAFLALEGLEWSKKGFTPASSNYGSLYFTITGFHMAHVIVGALMLTMLTVWTLLGYFGARRHSAVSIAVIYWHFVTLVWVAVFFTFYVTPLLTL